MSDNFISSLHIYKLGHHIEEIRIRALNHIISKLDHVVITQIEFSRYLEMLKKLFEWFDFENFTNEEKVLNLIYTVLTSEISTSVINHIGPNPLINDLKSIENKISKSNHYLIDNIIKLIESINQNQNLQLISDLPLSYRSGQSTINRSKNDKIIIDSTATTFTGTERKSSSISGLQAGIPLNSPNEIRDFLYKSIPIVKLNWLNLVESDYHVLKSVEISLENSSQPNNLLNSCQFFCNVILQDFPAEVFLQRPTILTLFYDMIKNSPSTRITNAALSCLNKLTDNLIIRIRFFTDPCTFNVKNDTLNKCEPNLNILNFSSNRENDAGKSGAGDSPDENLPLNEKNLPEFCIETFLCALDYISEKPQSFRDSVNRKKTQSGINVCLQLIDKLVILTNICIKPIIWNNKDEILDVSNNLTNVFNKFGNVLEQYRLMVAATDMEYFERMAQLHLLHSISNLLTELVPISKADSVLPRSLKNALSISLLDASFSRLYPTVHETLVQYVNVFRGQNESDSLRKYKDIKIVCNAMSKAVKILNCNQIESLENLPIIFDSLPCLEFHKNLSIINIFFKICIKNHSVITLNKKYLKLVKDILLNLLSNSDENIRKETYSLCQKLIVNILGLNHTQHMSQTDPGSQIIFFFQTEIFIEIAAHGLTNDSIQIQTHSEDILIHVLKCKLIVSENVWKKLIRELLPAMPILQCFSGFETPLGKAIFKFFDPDISNSLFISTIDVLKSNLRILFSKDIRLRNESVSRLCWLITTEKNANLKIPKIKYLDDRGLSNIFQIDYQIDLLKKRSSHQFYEVGCLQKVIDLLSTENIEPSIRRSALTQISVMLEDPLLHPCFLEQNGLELLLNIFENSLLENEYENYPDSVIPIINILKNICLYNSIIRQELSLNLSLIFNLLRALFLYCTDKRMQSDAAIFTCLLLFSEFSICSFSGKEFSGFSLPEIVVKKLNIPFKCNTHWKISRYAKSSLFDFLMEDNWCKTTLKMHWNIEWFGGISELLKMSHIPNIAGLTNKQLSEFNSDLRLTKPDLLSLKASSVSQCCQHYLFDIENATTHDCVIEAVRGISGYIMLWLIANKTEPYCDNLLKLPWESAFSRFLSAPPANSDDQNLLIEIINCCNVLLKLYKNSGQSCWIVKILQDPGHYLTKLLQIDVKNDHKKISVELLYLISDCSILEQNLLDIGILSGNRAENNNKNWIHIIKMITENLKFSDTEQFYNLAYLDKLLLCLVQITSNLGWSELNFTDKLFLELIEALSELLTAFHYGKGSEAGSSFMGVNITRNALLTMNHILFEMQHTNKKNWELFWINNTICSSTIFSLLSLWSCRDVLVRAATLQLLSGFAIYPRGAAAIVENIHQKNGGIWETTLSILIDRNEASIVREQCANLLANICSHANIQSNGQINISLCHAPLTSNKNKISPINIILTLLKEYNFYEELEILLNCLYLESSLSFVPKSKILQPVSARTYVQTSSGSISSANEEVNIFSTPSFVKSAANYLNNLLFLAPEKISEFMAEFGLIRAFFRCLTSPSLDLTNSKSLLFYNDILEMNSAICTLLTQTIMISSSCKKIILHTRDCLYVLVSLLNQNLFNTDKPHFLYLRNQLWSEIFKFLTALLENNKTDLSRDEFSIISTLLNECGHEPFFKSVCESIESKSSSLQKSALQSLTSLLSIKTILSPKPFPQSSLSLQNFLDSPQFRESLEENIQTSKNSLIPDLTQRQSLLESYKNSFTETFRESPSKSQNLMIGANLCKILLKLFELQSLENKDNKRKMIIIRALSSLLNSSEDAKNCALNEGLLSTVLTQLKNLHVELSLHSVESYRKISEKKKICPILKEVDSLIIMLTNFIIGNENAKKTASEINLADIIHKFWVWFCFDKNLLINNLKLICTFTTNCSEACHSLTLTNSTPGSGPRKIVTNASLLNAIICLILREMELISRSHDVDVLKICLQILKNICSVVECRTVLTKSNLFHCLNRLHPAITKRQRPWETVESLWLEFLEIFTFYPEGQLHITKTNDILDLILTLTSSLKSANKLIALSVLRNISFHHSNRVKLLASVEFIQVLHNKLTNGTLQEKNLVVSMIWALVANNQRSKIIIKCAGLDARIQDILRQFEMQGINDKSYQTMLYVFSILKEGEK